jgi:hypothetical protein
MGMPHGGTGVRTSARTRVKRRSGACERGVKGARGSLVSCARAHPDTGAKAVLVGVADSVASGTVALCDDR